MLNFYQQLLTKVPKGKKTLEMRQVIDLWQKENPPYEGQKKWESIYALICEMQAKNLVIFRQGKGLRAGNMLFPATLVFPEKSKPEPENYDWVKDYNWHPSLVPFVNSISRQTLNNAKIINEWLKNNTLENELVPLRERSYEIFNDEKYMDKWKGGLFGLAIPLDIIGAYWPPSPMVFENTNIPNRPLLIIENSHTYASFSRWNMTAKKWSGVAYGKGCNVETMTESISAVIKICKSSYVEYFGDLDPKGIFIMAQLIERCETENIDARPFYEGYKWLIENGKGNAGASTAFSDDAKINLSKYFSQYQEKIIDLWKSGLRIPQEAISYQKLKYGIFE